jgi:hypothetical protein
MVLLRSECEKEAEGKASRENLSHGETSGGCCCRLATTFAHERMPSHAGVDSVVDPSLAHDHHHYDHDKHEAAPKLA